MPPFWWDPDKWLSNSAGHFPRQRARDRNEAAVPPELREVREPRDWIAEEWMDADQFLLRQVARGLARDRQVRGRRIEVLVQNMVVVLTGEVDSPEAKRAARRRAWAVPGVFDVCDCLTVTEAG